MRLAVILVCVGAANTLTSPRRLLKSMPSALYEVGVATSVALAFAPQAVVSATRLRAARRLRGHPDHGLRSLRGLAVPVLEGALDRSVELAAAMDARGFGRSGSMSARRRLAVAAMTVIGLLALLASSYGLLVPDAPAATGLPLLLAGGAVTAVAFSLGARRGGRTRYRPDRWRAAEWLVGACGVAAAVALVLGPASGELPSASPPHWPPVPLVPLLGFLLAALPAWLAPPQPRPTRSLPVPAKPPRSAAAMVGAR
jgi:energy-coupling factor transport system permease protein